MGREHPFRHNQLFTSTPTSSTPRLDIAIMSYVIFGRAVKSEYLTLATLGAVGAIVALTKGGSKAPEKLAPGQTIIDKVKESVPINASSSEEEQLMDSIRKFIAEAEKEQKH
ncbi:hypothetical protein HGRIS_000509 [Hohenbuehelia grisea]|uniref:Uncharacterized protein n=1 Tax=Hohenbuehelia grisea TaxID=104357 RepID=A0ABR3JR93_9AGAR